MSHDNCEIPEHVWLFIFWGSQPNHLIMAGIRHFPFLNEVSPVPSKSPRSLQLPRFRDSHPVFLFQNKLCSFSPHFSPPVAETESLSVSLPWCSVALCSLLSSQSGQTSHRPPMNSHWPTSHQSWATTSRYLPLTWQGLFNSLEQ